MTGHPCHFDLIIHIYFGQFTFQHHNTYAWPFLVKNSNEDNCQGLKMCEFKNFSMVDILQLTDQISAQDNTSIHLLNTQQLDT